MRQQHRAVRLHVLSREPYAVARFRCRRRDETRPLQDHKRHAVSRHPALPGGIFRVFRDAPAGVESAALRRIGRGRQPVPDFRPTRADRPVRCVIVPDSDARTAWKAGDVVVVKTGEDLPT